MAWASTRGNAENAHACALRTAPATQYREVRGRHLGLPHHQERHGQPAVTAGGSGAAVGPGRRPVDDVAPAAPGATRSSRAALGLPQQARHQPRPPWKAAQPGPWRLPPSGTWSGDRDADHWSWPSSARPTPMRPPDRHGAGAGGRAEASPTSTGFRGYRTAEAGSSGAGRAASSPARKDPLGRRATCRCQSTDRCRTTVITHASMFCLSGQVTDERRAGTWRCAQATR
jgi:hypothetical protein